MSGFTFSTNPSSSPQFSFPPSSSPLSFPPSSSSSSSPFSLAFPQQSSSPSPSPFSFSNPNHSFGAPPSSAPSFGFGFAPSSPPISSAFGSSVLSSPLHEATPAGASQALFGATSSSASFPFGTLNFFGANSSSPISSTTTSSLFGSSSNSRTTSLFASSTSSSVSSGTTYTTSPISSALFRSPSPSSATDTLASSASTTVSSTIASFDSAHVVSSPLAAEPVPTLESPVVGVSSTSTIDSTVAATGCQDSIGGSPICSPISFKLAFGDEEEGDKNEDEQINDRTFEQPGVQMADCEVVVSSSMVVSSGAAVATVPVVEANSIKMDILDVKSAATYVRVTLHAKELEIDEVDSCENLSAVSEIVAGYELKPPGVGSLISPISEMMTDSNELTLSPHYGLIIEQISTKYGDITKGSILKSMAAKFPFLQLVAHIVHRLSNHTLDTLGVNELELIQTWTADTAAVGFQVDWLQQRVKQVTAAIKYHGHRVELDELGKQIDATIKYLMEMEFREMVWKEELASIKAEMEGNNFGGSVLSTGLL